MAVAQLGRAMGLGVFCRAGTYALPALPHRKQSECKWCVADGSSDHFEA
ncbi:hypothetical protein [Acetobacter syzygii]